MNKSRVSLVDTASVEPSPERLNEGEFTPWLPVGPGRAS